MNSLRKFNPISKEWQKSTCDKIGLTFHDTELYDEINDNQYLGEPLNCLKIKGDGNCLFRCLACAICGDEEKHFYFRQIITSFIAERKESVLSNESPKEYLEKSCMRDLGIWGTDIELYYSALCFNISIYVYTKHGSKYDWLEFKPASLTNGKAIYFHHRNGNHYDVVRSVSKPSESNICQLSSTLQEENVILPECFDNQEDFSEIDLSDFLQGMSFEDKDESSNVNEENTVGTSKTDPFDFEEEDLLPYHIFPTKFTSTPKKSIKLQSLKVDVEDYDTIAMDASSDMGHISKITDTSICNSSFEEAVQNAKSRKKISRNHNNLLLRKALIDIPLAMSKRKRCHKYCLQTVNEKLMKSMRYKFWTKSFEQRVEWFIDKISESKKKQNSIRFQIESGKSVCGSCFQFLLRMNHNFYYTYMKMANDGKTAAGYRNTRGYGEAREGAIVWLQNYQFFHADRMPDNGDMMLAFKTRKRDIYNIYVKEKIECLERSVFDALTVSQSAFYDIWKNEFPQLKIKQTNSFSKCSTCVHIDRELEKTRDPAKRAKLKQMMRVHNQRQMAERRYYYRKRDIAKIYPQKHMSIIIDGMDQSKTNLPHFTGRIMKGVDPNSFLKTHVQGVLNHGLGTFDVYVDVNEYSHDSNLVMNVILKTIHNSISKDGYLPQKLYIQADNCARENKNRFVLGFCELLVRLSIFHEDRIVKNNVAGTVSFLHVGHTHEDIDAAFSQLAMRLRRSDAETIPKLLNILNGAKQIKGLFDIKSWLQPHLRDIKHHSKPLHFKFCKNESQTILMQYRANSNRPWVTTDEDGILSGIPQGEPQILLPTNFHKMDLPNIRSNIQKQQYNMSDEGQFRWWISYLDYLQVVKDDHSFLKEYALEGAIWLLPELVNRQRKSEEDLVEINNHLLEMLDRELDEHKVIMPKRREEHKKKKKGRKG